MSEYSKALCSQIIEVRMALKRPQMPRERQELMHRLEKLHEELKDDSAKDQLHGHLAYIDEEVRKRSEK